MRKFVCAWIAGVFAASLWAAEPKTIPAAYSLLYEQSFDQADVLQQFAMTDRKAWQISRTNNNAALELIKQSAYKLPVVKTADGKDLTVRSPFNIALIADQVFGDFILEADLMQTGREYGHRDMCLFFGVQSPTEFYYAHIATAADPNAHNIFVVNNKPRTNIAKQTTKGVNWGLGVWHKVRLERKLSDGTIKVYFDDFSTPIMVAEDKTFGAGYIGFGSFDDTGMVDNVKVWGRRLKDPKKPVAFYQRPGK